MRKLGSFMTGVVMLVSAGLALGEEAAKMPTPKPGPEHKKLEYFVGNWTTEGDLKANPFGPAGKISSKDSCKWFEGGFAVVCNSSGMGPSGASMSLGILGYSSQEKVYTYYGIDNSAMVSTTVAKGTVEGDTWSYTSEDKMGGKTITSRYRIKIASPSSYTFTWEVQGEDGKWASVLEGKSTRAGAAAAPPAKGK